MIEYNLSREQHFDIMEYAHNTNFDMKTYLKKTFHGVFDFKLNATSNDPDFWGTITFDSEEYRTWFLLRWA